MHAERAQLVPLSVRRVGASPDAVTEYDKTLRIPKTHRVMTGLTEGDCVEKVLDPARRTLVTDVLPRFTLYNATPTSPPQSTSLSS